MPRPFLWLVLALMGMSCRMDLAGVTNFVRVLGLKPRAYHRLLHLFHGKGLDLEKLTTCWLRLVPTLFKPLQAGGADGPNDGSASPTASRSGRKVGRCLGLSSSTRSPAAIPSPSGSWATPSRPSLCWSKALPVGNIARAQGMSLIAKETGLSRESLYTALSEDGNPRLTTFLKVIHALGIDLKAQASA